MEKKEHVLPISVVPNHVAIVPDGNRRWAKNRDLLPWEGHRFGAENTEKLIKTANNLGIKCLSFWGSSQDNLTKRPIREKKELLDVYKVYFERLLRSDEIHKNGVRIRVLGEWEKQFPESLKSLLLECIDITKEYTDRMLNFFLAYNGDREMLFAIQKMIEDGISARDIHPETIKKYLFTKDIPSVDYLVRTGGEPHLSAGFMMWEVANAQLFFSDTCYPDFGPEMFTEAIEEFSRRKRRLGA
ncbi:MAG: di-trans,poly-cis-decaprenylcistransferase [Candidatus Moraniibacteriota bacterium]|nr:MAG: di-trans,poly-cis-decaprenylcistransferase [Candidatus Moranbacteria bacterium]